MRAQPSFPLVFILPLIALNCSPKLSFDRPSTELKRTQIVATLDREIEKGKNVIWCASFLSAWKTLQNDLAGEPIALETTIPLVSSLNGAPDPRPHVPQGALYAIAGWQNQGILGKIRSDLKHQFPSKNPPVFPGIAPDGFVAYSYLEAGIKFPVPYFQNRKPLEFTAGDGKKTEIHSFGIRDEDAGAYSKLRKQSSVLFCNGWPREDFEFALDLCADSTPSQIVVARISRGPSLTAALARVNKETTRERSPKDEFMRKISPDTLLIPDFLLQISHHFSELERKHFKNKKLAGQRLDVAQQDVLFRLDRSGAELRSEAKMYSVSPLSRYILDRPFLIYMKKRNAETPYFAMWVDNAELLKPW